MSSIVHSVNNNVLSIDDVIKFAQSADASSISTAHPNQPRNGEVYLYSKPALQVKVGLQYNPSLDGRTWIRRGGRNIVRKPDPMVSRSYFNEESGTADALGSLSRIVYEVYTKANTPVVVVHYRMRSSSRRRSSPSSGIKIHTRSTTNDADALSEVCERPSRVLNKDANTGQEKVRLFTFIILMLIIIIMI